MVNVLFGNKSKKQHYTMTNYVAVVTTFCHGNVFYALPPFP